MNTITIEKTVTTVEKVPVEIKLPYYAKGAGSLMLVYGSGERDAIVVYPNISCISELQTAKAFDKHMVECSEEEFMEAFNKANSHIHSIIQEKILVAV